jgi:brefeldin A-inhibited guanine nucleotide-exchange protein
MSKHNICSSYMQVFTTAATDEHKSIVLLAFETIEKIVREYFPYITETETTTFTDCVNCLIAFTNSRFNKDVSLNAIAFLRFCALKLAEGELGASARIKSLASPKQGEESSTFTDKDDHLYFWFPLLAGAPNFYSKTLFEKIFQCLLKYI